MTTSMTLPGQRSELPGQCHTPGWTLVHLPRTMCAAVDSGHFLLFSQRRQPSNKSRTKLSPIPGSLSIFHRHQFHLFAY